MAAINRHFITSVADRSRLPVVILSGFLGSGKTTLVNAVLRDASMARTAVAVNEFGAIPLDADLIDHGQDKTVVMANGCLCCNLAGDLEDAVMRLFSRREHGSVPHFERLIIEPSGLADPAPIAQGILRNPVLSRSLSMEAIVTIVDALFVEGQVQRFSETRKQIALADNVLISKADLTDDATLKRVTSVVRQLNPLTTIRTVDARPGERLIDPADLFPSAFLDIAAPRSLQSAPLCGYSALDAAEAADHAGDYVAVSLQCWEQLDWHRFDAWLKSIRLGHAEQVLRIKGMLYIAGADGPIVVHGVHHVLHAPVQHDRWPDSGPQSRLVLIVSRTVAADVQASWNQVLPSLFNDVQSRPMSVSED